MHKITTMKRTVIYLLIALMLTSLTAFLPNDKDYDTLWKKVEKLQKEGLPKSALKFVDQVYAIAKKEHNSPQKIKALIYKASLGSSFRENYFLKYISIFEREISTAETPEKQLLYSLTAQLYNNYFTQNRYKILQRKQLYEHGNDIETWDAVQFNKKIKEYYLLSLQPEDSLKNISLKQFEPILILADSNRFQYRKTLYDLLASRAVNYFSGNSYQPFNFDNTFSMPSDSLMIPVSKFIKLNIKPVSKADEVLKLYQNLLKLHINDDNPETIVDLDLARIDFINRINPVNTKAIRNILEQLYQKYKITEVSVRIALQLAKNYQSGQTKYRIEHNSSKTPPSLLVKARNLCKEAVEQHPHALFANNCRNFLTTLEQPSVTVKIEKQLLPGKPFLANINFKNITRLYCKIVKVNSEKVMLDTRHNYKSLSKDKKYLSSRGIRNMMVDLPDTKDLLNHSTEIKIDPLPLGTYYIYFSSDKNFKNSSHLGANLITVTNLSFITKFSENQIEFLVQNRLTGKGMEKVKGEFFYIDYRKGKNRIKKTGSFITGNNGFANNSNSEYKYGRNTIVRLTKNADTLYQTEYLYKTGRRSEKPVITTHIFTDRSIYRPGQVVYYKGIVVQKEGDKFSVLTNYKTKISLKNTTNKTISTQEVITNKYGSFSGSFVIPSGSLNGTMRLRAYHGIVQFSVEEYKRPTFLVMFDTVKNAYKYNDDVIVTGKVKYFNGLPVANAKIIYRVTHQNYFPVPWYWYRPVLSAETDIVNGTAKVDKNGNFSITFNAVAGSEQKASQFTVYADVTDITGEVHSGKTNIKISSKPLWIAFKADNEIDKNNNPEINIAATNTAGQPLRVTGKLHIFALQQPNRIIINRLWPKPDTPIMTKEEYQNYFSQIACCDEENKDQWKKKLVITKTLSWSGDTTLPVSLVQNLKPGYYKFVFSTDYSGSHVSDSVTTLVFCSGSKKPVVKQDFWMYLSKEVAKPGETVDLLLSSASKHTWVYYELSAKNKIIEKRRIKLNKKQLIIPIFIQESWRGGVRINLVVVKNNRRHVIVKRIKVPFTNKKLNIKLQTFRDHLTPGKKETWSVKITGYKGDKVASELLAAMYDQSLDQINNHQWNFSLFHQYNGGNGWFGRQFAISDFYQITNRQPEHLADYSIKYPAINWFGMQLMKNNYAYYRLEAADAGMSSIRKSSQQIMLADNNNDFEGTEGTVNTTVTKQNSVLSSPPVTTDDVQPSMIRTDFRETAFFYPQLHTDSTCSVVFSFTTPDALTQWKLMMLAHTPDLSSDIEELSFKAYKELMVMPNVPRFVRQGDMLMFSARVTNFSDKEQKVRISLNFFDPISNKKLNLFVTRMPTGKELNLNSGESSKVSWQIAIPDNINMMAYRIAASSKTFFDGEERVIPVLTNRVLVTETMPMYVKAHGNKKYTFTRLINQGKTTSLSTLKNFRYTLEFTSNPAWYAIQSLPYLSKPQNESALSIYRAWFANALSGWIVNSTPKIKAVFDSWKINSPDAFLSALQKDSELKNTVLEETPWVLEAKNEAKQKQRIALLFDLNNLRSRRQVTLNRMQQLQLSSGAWPWFRGMNDDRYTTQEIVLGIAKLLDNGVIGLKESGLKTMLDRAVSYLDRKIIEDYDNLKKQKNVKMKRQHISSFQIQYLYARTLLKDEFSINKRSVKAYNYYLEQAKQYWLKQNNYLQAMITIIMFENGYRNEAEAILRSLEERSLYNDEMGMYWRLDHGWYWYQAPVETQAMIIEAFGRLNYNPQNIYKMKIWLLKQKQTQRWATSSATAEAVSALLMTGNSNLLWENKPVSITMDSKFLSLEENGKNPEAGTGYFKKIWPGSEVKPAMGIIKIENPNNHITWGAAYWQYFEEVDKVTASSSPLKVEKKLFVETLTDDGPVFKDVSEKKLKAGDKLMVRLIIRTDRNMEFVQLKDVRATGMEVLQQLSGYSHKGGLGYYRNNKDASTSFFFRYLNKGTYVLEYSVRLTQQGTFPVGLASIQCLYAPEFAAHSQGEQIEVTE